MKRFFTFLLALSSFTVFCQSGGVSITPTGGAPDPSAAFDVNFTNKGLLMPRLTQAQRDSIVNPANGLTIYNTDCNVYNFNAGTPASPNWATLNSSNALVAGVSIAVSPTGAICSGTSVTFTATPSAGINSPNYQWQLNAENVGSNSSTYTSTTLNNGDVVSCILSTSQACVSGSPANSNSIAMTVNTVPGTPGSISGSSSVCPATSGNVYSVSPVAGATSYSWTIPGDATIASGAGTNSITVTFGSTSGNISVIAFNSCGTSSAVSQAVTVNPAVPSTPGTITGGANAAAGSSGNSYYISPVNNATTYTWTVPSGSTITAGQGTDSITVTFGSNSGNISVTAGNSCGTSSSNSLAVTLCNNYSPGTETYNYTASLQTFTVPACTFSLTISAYGAQGGNHAGVSTGGYGAEITGTFSVTPGEALTVLVGGQGTDGGQGPNNGGSGGGGGTFVYSAGSNLLIAAGGGGGAALQDDGGSYPDREPGQSGNNGSSSRSCWPGGTNGGNGSGNLAGFGWNTIMGDPNPGCECSSSCSSCGACGCNEGYGGGGADAYDGGGGGGGYSGGGGDTANDGCGVYGDGGGGGGSYNAGSNQTNSSGVQSGNGQVVFTW